MESPWRRSIFYIFLILSFYDLHVFCQNVSPCGVQPQLLNAEVNRECLNANGIPPGPQLMNTMMTIAAANGVLPEMLPSLGPIQPGNPQLQEILAQQQGLLPFNPQGPLFPPGLQQSSGILNPNLILPSPNLPASLPCAPTPPTPTAPPPCLAQGLIPQNLLPPTIQPPFTFPNPLLTNNGIVRPFLPRATSQPSSCNSEFESNIIEANTVALNSAAAPNAIVRPINQPFMSSQQQCTTQLAPNSYLANQNLQSELNRIVPLQTNQQIVNQFSNNYPVQSVPPGYNPSPIIRPSFDIFQPYPVVLQQPQLLNTPQNCPSSQTVFETEVNSRLSTLQERDSSLLSAENNVELTSIVNTAKTEIQQPVFAEERSQQSPFNFQINIPPLNLPAPSITLINTPSNVPVAPVSAPVVPSFGGYPPIQPIILEGSRSKLRSLLPIILIALLSDDGGYGGNCGCSGSCSCSNNNIPIPYPIPVPVNNPIITTSGKGRKSPKKEST